MFTSQVFITGQTSYIGSTLAQYLESLPSIQVRYNTAQVEQYAEVDFREVDVIVHTMELTHRNQDEFLASQYQQVNCDFTVEMAKKAKEQGVQQFVFMSSIAIFGCKSHMQRKVVIDEETFPIPTTAYGKSKRAAERQLAQLEDNHFKVAIIRPPIVYGPNCPGSYAQLRKWAKWLPIMPDIENERSMLFIDNLVECITQIITYGDRGYFHPQDSEYHHISNVVQEIRAVHDKQLFRSKFAGTIVRKFLWRFKMINHLFGHLTYAKSFSLYRHNSYQKIECTEAIRRIEEHHKDINSELSKTVF